MHYPLALGGMFLLWLMLNQTISLGQALIGLGVAATSMLMLRALRIPGSGARSLRAVVHLLGLVLVDIIRSNLAVAKIIIVGGPASSGFVRIPLELRHSYALAVLACIITATPGTVWVTLDESDGTLTIHVLDLVDEAEWIRTIKGRYERLLLEIFP